MAEERQQTIPVHQGAGLAAVILGAAVVPLAVIVGLCSLMVDLPVFGVWWFLPVVAVAIALGIFASRTSGGVAGAALGVVALLICLLFVIVDRSYGPEIRGQLRAANQTPSRVNLEELMKSVGQPATKP